MENVQKVANIYKEVKRYKYNPEYTLHIATAANFSFELLVNDYPIKFKYAPGIITGSMPINEAILKPGKQSLTVRMTPPVDDEFNMGKEIDLSLAELKLSINYGDYSQQKVKDFKEVFTYEMSKKEGKVPFYEINLFFEAPEVPYEHEVQGWTNSVDLSKENKEELLKEVEVFYKDLIHLYESQDVNGLAGKYYKRQYEIAQSLYQNKEYKSKAIVNGLVEDVNEKAPFIFFGYQMKFYGNGKLVKLAKMEDKYYLNFSALMREDSNGDATQYFMYLHRPKAGAPLEVIR